VIDEWVKEDGKDVKVGDLIQRYNIKQFYKCNYLITIYRMTLDVFGKSIFEYDFNVKILPN
jgi:hypothetical protein